MEAHTLAAAMKNASKPLGEAARADVAAVLDRILPREDTPVLEVAAFNSSI